MRIKKTSGTAILTGNIINSLESDSQFNAPSIETVNKKTNGIVLYENTTGSNTTLNLNGNLLEGKLLSIYFKKASNVGVATFPITQTDFIITLTSSNWFASNSLQQLYKSCSVSVANNTITHLFGGYVNMISNVISQANENEIYITKVIMFK